MAASHRIFFDSLGAQLGYKSMEHWYNITKKEICENGGTGLLNTYYKGSPSTALQRSYPEHEWELSKFKNKPLSFWKSKKKHLVVQNLTVQAVQIGTES